MVFSILQLHSSEVILYNMLYVSIDFSDYWRWFLWKNKFSLQVSKKAKDSNPSLLANHSCSQSSLLSIEYWELKCSSNKISWFSINLPHHHYWPPACVRVNLGVQVRMLCRQNERNFAYDRLALTSKYGLCFMPVC